MVSTRKILAETSHRQYPIPDKPWKYYQEWHDVRMMHWKVPVTLVEALLPEGLVLDTYEGGAWVSLFAFRVKKLRPRFLPPIPFLSSFNEINFRTYVIRDGRPGIYFFSVEADRLVPLMMARGLTGIPYVGSKMESGSNWFLSRNRRHGYHINISYKVNGVVKTEMLDYWLTERHCLYQQEGTRLYRFDIHHRQWKLYQVALAVHSLDYRAGGIALAGDPSVKHYSKKIGVIIWGKTLVADHQDTEKTVHGVMPFSLAVRTSGHDAPVALQS